MVSRSFLFTLLLPAFLHENIFKKLFDARFSSKEINFLVTSAPGHNHFVILFIFLVELFQNTGIYLVFFASSPNTLMPTCI